MRIDIDGELVANGQKFFRDDFCPQDFKDAVKDIEEGEQIDLHITSPGGNVIEGNVIVSLIRNAQRDGHKVCAYVHGMAASMASVIACACDELHIDDNAVLMMHLPWSCVEGNSNDMRKEVQLLDMLTKTLVSIYRNKFDKTDDEILQMLADETWILGSEASEYGLDCVVERSTEMPMKMAAKLCKYNYKNIPRGIKMKLEEELKKEDPSKKEGDTTVTEEEIKKVETSQNEDETQKEEPSKVEDPEKKETPKEEPSSETSSKDEPSKEDEPKKEDDPEKKEPSSNEDEPKDDEDMDEDDPEELKARIAELERENEELRNRLEQLSKEGEEKANARVSGMQSKMQSKINDFANQLKAREGELTKMKNEVTSLLSRIDESNNELKAVRADLAKTSSALQEKTDALDALNSRVLGRAEEVVDWRNLKGQEFWDFLDKHPEIIKQH